MTNKNHSSNNLHVTTGFIANLCQIFGISIRSIINEVIAPYICLITALKLDISISFINDIVKYGIYALLIYCVLRIVANIYSIREYKTNKPGIPRKKARYSYLLTAFYTFILGMSLMYILIISENNYAKGNICPDDTECILDEECIDGDNHMEEIYNETNEDNQEYLKTNFTPLQKKVNDWVVICFYEVVSIEMWRTFSDEELYYIRNGILAYSHYKDKRNFYDVFPWYDGTISPDDFTWDLLNYYQQKNIENIESVEAERRTFHLGENICINLNNIIK